MLEILYQDEYLVAINKPHGLLVHRSPIAQDTSEFALQILRDQIQHWVNPVHRIDRKTSGILLFALDKETERLMQMQFAENKVDKKYLAIVRGYAPDAGEIDYPLKKDNGQVQDAFTSYRTLQRVEIPIPFGKHESSRYSLLEAKPITGRMHQIRKHLAHIFHPIIGDRPHGCNKQNKFFKDNWDITTMKLHAWQQGFVHPHTGKQIAIKANLQMEFTRTMDILGFSSADL